MAKGDDGMRGGIIGLQLDRLAKQGSALSASSGIETKA
jgi:hypothetical protein